MLSQLLLRATNSYYSSSLSRECPSECLCQCQCRRVKVRVRPRLNHVPVARRGIAPPTSKRGIGAKIRRGTHHYKESHTGICVSWASNIVLILTTLALPRFHPGQVPSWTMPLSDTLEGPHETLLSRACHYNHL